MIKEIIESIYHFFYGRSHSLARIKEISNEEVVSFIEQVNLNLSKEGEIKTLLNTLEYKEFKNIRPDILLRFAETLDLIARTKRDVDIHYQITDLIYVILEDEELTALLPKYIDMVDNVLIGDEGRENVKILKDSYPEWF